MDFPFSCVVDLVRKSLHFSISVAAIFAMVPASVSSAAVPDTATTFLTTQQQADGSWTSTTVRRSHATVEALRALQGSTTSASARAAAVSYLEATLIEDTDDRARRIKALAGEGRTITALVTQLLADQHSQGGWGLTPEFVADPLDPALALAALASQWSWRAAHALHKADSYHQLVAVAQGGFRPLALPSSGGGGESLS